MKSQKSKYILLILVIVVWSMIIVRFFSMKGNDEIILHLKEVKAPLSEKQESVVTFDLHLDYDDPFLDGGVTSPSMTEKVLPADKADSKKSENKDTLKVKLPAVSYNGMLSNLSTGEKVGFLVLERKEYMLKTGDSITGLLIIALANDSVQVQYSGQIFAIKKRKND